jgi:hypothetical protein
MNPAVALFCIVSKVTDPQTHKKVILVNCKSPTENVLLKRPRTMSGGKREALNWLMPRALKQYTVSTKELGYVPRP